jgi:hypothetical protein
VNDFESRLQTLLNERVDAQLGPRRTPPVFIPRPDGRKPWLLPLLAAAAVIAVVAGSVAAVRLTDSHPGPAPATRPPSVTHTPGPTFAPDRSGTVTTGGVTITLPPGWVLRDYHRYLGPGMAIGFQGEWCLTPRSTVPKVDGCPVRLERLAAKTAGLAPDIQGGILSNPHFCYPLKGRPRETFQAETRQFGGRAAEWRRWTIACANSTKRYVIEQYVVTSGPPYILFAPNAGPAEHDAMTSIVHSATLPARTSTLELADEGYLRTISHHADGVHITIDRVATGDGHVIHLTPRTRAYVVPTRVFRHGTPSGDRLHLGDLVYVGSDGTRVTQVFSISSF